MPPIWGISDKELIALRRTAAATMRPTARGRSLTMTHLLHDLPTARFEVAPVIQYARAVWQAVTARETAALRKCGLPEIRGWWEDSMQQVKGILEEYDAEKAMGRTPTSNKNASKAWRNVRGPIGAAALSLRRIGWEFATPFTLIDDRGIELTLTHSTPQLLKDQLVDGVRRSLERQMAHKWSSRCQAYAGRRICTDLAAASIKKRASTSPLGAGAFRAAICGAVMTRSRAVAGGYDVPDVCPLCGCRGDTLRHRMYECSKTAEAAEAVAPNWFLAEARRADPTDPFWETGVFPHPADLAPLPSAGITVAWDSGPDEMQGVIGESPSSCGGKDVGFGGYIYMDGSALPHVIKDLSRAGSAVLMTDGSGNVLRRGLVAVPNHLPQTSQVSEGLALAVTVRALTRRALVSGDCKAVVDAANAPCAKMLAARRKHGGLLMDVLRDPERRRLAGDTRWVKAHRKCAEDASEETRRDIKGNDAADAAASEPRKMHPPSGTGHLPGLVSTSREPRWSRRWRLQPSPCSPRTWQHAAQAQGNQRPPGRG